TLALLPLLTLLLTGARRRLPAGRGRPGLLRRLLRLLLPLPMLALLPAGLLTRLGLAALPLLSRLTGLLLRARLTGFGLTGLGLALLLALLLTFFLPRLRLLLVLRRLRLTRLPRPLLTFERIGRLAQRPAQLLRIPLRLLLR